MAIEYFNNQWFYDDETIKERIQLVNNEWDYINNKFPVFKEHFENTPVLPLEFTRLLAYLRPISNELLSDAIWINSDIFYISKSDEFKNGFYKKLSEITNIFLEFISSNEYKKMLIEKEVSGDDEIQLGNLKVKISHTAILQHIERINAKPMFSKEIWNVYDDLVKFHEDRKNKNDIMPPPFPTRFNQDQLKTIYTRSIDKKVIKCLEDDFLYWFAGMGARGNKINWILIGKNNKPHRSGLFWYCRKLNPESTATMMKKSGAFNIEVNRNDNQYNPTKDLESIFNNL